MNYDLKIDLLKVRGAYVSHIADDPASTCLVIPITGSGLFQGQKGVYLDMNIIESRENRFGESHYARQSVDNYRELTDEQKRSIPILGNMKEWNQQPAMPQGPQPAPPQGNDQQAQAQPRQAPAWYAGQQPQTPPPQPQQPQQPQAPRWQQTPPPATDNGQDDLPF